MDSKTQLPVFYQNLIQFVRDHPEQRTIISHIESLAASATLTDLDSGNPEAHTAGHRVYDAIIEKIFTSTLQALSREALLTQTIETLWSQKPSRSNLCLFVLEAMAGRTAGEMHDIKTVMQQGLNENRWRNFSEQILPQLQKSRFLQDLLVNSESVPLWLNVYIPSYAGEFDVIARPGRNEAQKYTSYWVSAIALRSGQVGCPNRVVVALYANRGDEATPKLPPGANQEWRVLQFLGMAYQVLQHQLANIAEEVYGQRQRLLSFLAPGILHHEIGNQSANIHDLLTVSRPVVQRLHDNPQKEDAERLLKNFDFLMRAANRLTSIADAFNNMERRRPRETVTLEAMLKEIEILTYNRLGKVGVQLLWEPAPMLQTLETDPALLLHVVLNIVINIINAFEEGQNSGMRERTVARILTEKTSVPEIIRLTIYNNGPEIPEALHERIFEKGFTTRPSGHGHGLYICRLITEALRGQIYTLPNTALPAQWSVGFQIDLPVVAGRDLDLIGERRAGKL